MIRKICANIFFAPCFVRNTKQPIYFSSLETLMFASLQSYTSATNHANFKTAQIEEAIPTASHDVNFKAVQFEGIP